MVKVPLYLKGYFLLLVPGVLIWGTTRHGDIVLWVNQYRNTLMDTLMPVVTFLGDGIMFAIVALAVLLYHWRSGLVFGVAGGIQAGITALLKRIIFPSAPRPSVYFGGSEEVSFLEGYVVHAHFSFPSGHTVSVFLLTALVGCVFPGNRSWQAGLLVIAIITGFSRIYLLQHFYRDVLFGSLIGVLIAIVVWYGIRPFLLRINFSGGQR